MKVGIKKFLKTALIGGVLFAIPALFIGGVLAVHEDFLDWIGFIYFIFLFAEVAVLCCFKQAYAFVVKKPTVAKALAFGGVYYLLWVGFFFFMLLVVLGQAR